MTNQEKLTEVFGEGFTIVSFPVANGKYKSYAIMTPNRQQVRIETWLGQNYVEVEDDKS